MKKSNAGAKRKFTDEERVIRKQEALKQWKLNNPKQSKSHELQAAYGISLSVYNMMLFKQDGCCAICGKHHTEFNKALAVDHCHETGELRGLLCVNCNLAIGNFFDDIKIIKQAATYLSRYKLK